MPFSSYNFFSIFFDDIALINVRYLALSLSCSFVVVTLHIVFCLICKSPPVYIIYRLILYPRYFSPLRHFPGPPPGHAIFGQLDNLHGRNVGSIQQAWFDRYGSIVRVIAPLGMERLVIKNEEALSQILGRAWGDWDKAPYIETLLRIMAGNTGMMTTYGEPSSLEEAFQSGVFVGECGAA